MGPHHKLSSCSEFCAWARYHRLLSARSFEKLQIAEKKMHEAGFEFASLLRLDLRSSMMGLGIMCRSFEQLSEEVTKLDAAKKESEERVQDWQKEMQAAFNTLFQIHPECAERFQTAAQSAVLWPRIMGL